MLGLLQRLGSFFQQRSTTKAVSRSKPRRDRRLSVEALETREVLSASPQYQDPTSTAWVSNRDLTETQWTQVFAERKSSYLPVDLEIIDAGGGSPRISAIWNANTDNRGWYLWRNLSSTDFGAKWETYRSQGYRLTDQDTYQLGGTTYYSGIWVQNKENIAWASRRNMTSSGYQTFYTEYKTNYLPVDIDVTQAGGSLKYSAVFERNTKGLAWTARHDLTSSQFSTLFNQLKGTYRVTDIESYQVGGEQRYAVIWVKSDTRGWAEYRDMTETGYWNKWNELTDQGYRPVDFERYTTSSGVRYAGVWRQDGSRLNWNLKGQVDALALKQLNDFKVPGLSVTVSQNGQFLYRRGFGYQDVEGGLQYSSMTVNRIASVSKAVAGVLTMALVDKKLVDINRTTRSYVPTMPAFQAHTLKQLLSNRGGVGHYAELGDVTGTYATALAAAKQFWLKPLAVKVGNYHYTTHGYTLLGAALEGALGTSIKAIAQKYLTDAFQLGTLKVEDRAVYDRYRSAVYGSSTTKAATPDSLSWKTLGGGFEASGLDLANFAYKLLSGKILSTASRTSLWTAPDTKAAYALGWEVGKTSGGNKFVAKDGAQLGANTFLLVYPDKGIVVTVLMNRQSGGQNARTLANQIGKLLVS